MSKARFSTRMLTTLALLTAIEIVLSRFLSVNAWNIKIGFSFVPVVVAAILYGPIAAGIVAALGDFVGAILFPIGTYFPGFTLTAFLTGCVFGLFLHKKQSWPRIIAAVGGLCLIYPGTMTDVIGICAVGVVVVLQLLTGRNKAAAV